MKRIIFIMVLLFTLMPNYAAFADEAEQQKISPGKCHVYIIHPKQLYKISCPIYINGLLDTCLRHTTYVYREVNAGRIKISQVGASEISPYSEIIFNAEPGENYYIKVVIKHTAHNFFNSAPFTFDYKFIQIDESEWNELVSNCTEIDWSE